MIYEEFLERASIKHNNKYSYTPFTNISTKKKVEIYCPIHGTFHQRINTHLRGSGCPTCGMLTTSIKRNKGGDYYTQQIKEKHGDKFQFNLRKDARPSDTIKAICSVHGEFEAKIYSFIKGNGCQKCGNDVNGEKRRKLNYDSFIEHCNEIHNNKYTYPKFDYTSCGDKIKIICPVHGEFEQHIHVHYNGSGCPKCADETFIAPNKLVKEDIIKRFNEKHDNKYTYYDFEYTNQEQKIKMCCPIHGDFILSVNKHLNGRGCQQCGKEKGHISRVITRKGQPSKKKYSTQDIINKFKEVHGDTYDYSLVEYEGYKEKVKIICPTHGKFEQGANKHLLKRGCPHCKLSKQYSDKEVAWLNSLQNPNIIKQYRIPENKLYSFDGYDPTTRTGYLFHGDYFHGNPNTFPREEYNKLIKKTMGELYDNTIIREDKYRSYGYNLIIMWEKDWDGIIKGENIEPTFKKKIVKTKIQFED